MGPLAGQETSHSVRVRDLRSGGECVAVSVHSNEERIPMLVDEKTATKVQKDPHSVVLCNTYPSLDVRLVHKLVMGRPPEGESIDHISCIKMDNRSCNLRFATQGEQNANHEVPRIDRDPPRLELLEIGIDEYPLGMRYREDGSESRFDCEIRDANNVNITIRFSGSKSTEVSIVNKFRQACKQLLDILIQAGYTSKGNQTRARNTTDYLAIAKLVHAAYPEHFGKVPDDKASLWQIMYDRIGHVTACLERLPPILDGEKLHGPLHQPQRILEVPHIAAIAVQRPGCPVVLFDAVAREHMEALGKIEVGNRSARLHENGEKRGLLEKVWVDLLEREWPQGERVVTTLGHHLDLHAANLIEADCKRQLDGDEQWRRAARLQKEYVDAVAGLAPGQPVELSESDGEPPPRCGDKRARGRPPARQRTSAQPFVDACGTRVLVDAGAPRLPTLLVDKSCVRVNPGKPRGLQLLREHVWDDCGLEAGGAREAGVVVPLNYSHQDVRKANLAKVFGIKKAKAFSPPRCELPEQVRAAAPKEWRGLLPFGLKYCYEKERTRHVFTVSLMVGKSGVPVCWFLQTVKTVKFAGMQAALGKHYRSNVQLHGRDRFGPDDNVETVFREVNNRYVKAVQLACRELGAIGANIE